MVALQTLNHSCCSRGSVPVEVAILVTVCWAVDLSASYVDGSSTNVQLTKLSYEFFGMRMIRMQKSKEQYRKSDIALNNTYSSPTCFRLDASKLWAESSRFDPAQPRLTSLSPSNHSPRVMGIRSARQATMPRYADLKSNMGVSLSARLA